MHFTTLALATLLGGVAQAAFNVHVVYVGKNTVTNETGLKFFPNKVTAKAGEMVQFMFMGGNHTATQSSFDEPCAPISPAIANTSGFSSSFQPVAASAAQGEIPVYTIMINDTKPIWVYCGQGQHCKNGMSMVINENTAANATRSLENYQMLAQSVQPAPGAGAPDAGSGGNEGGLVTPPGIGSGGNEGGLVNPPGTGSGGNEGGLVTPPGASGSAPSAVGSQPSSTTAPLSAGINLAVPSTLLIALGVGFMFL